MNRSRCSKSDRCSRSLPECDSLSEPLSDSDWLCDSLPLSLEDSGTLVLIDPLPECDSLSELLWDSLLELAESLSLESLPLESLWLALDPLE
jgi:hypothetical protein